MKTVIWWIVACVVVVNAARGQEPTKDQAEKSVPPAATTTSAGSTENDGEGAKDGGNSDAKEIAAVSLPPPDWVRDARWYYLDIRRFRNGEKANDRPEVLPWGVRHPPEKGSFYGGDLQGLRQKLSYLKDLGVNAIILDCLFDDPIPNGHLSWDEMKHVIEDVGLFPNPVTESKSEWQARDKIFLELTSDARDQGFRIVVTMPLRKQRRMGKATPTRFLPHRFENLQETFWKVDEHWLRKSADSTSPGGIDGWAIHPDSIADADDLAHWRKHIKTINSDCVLLALNPTPSSERPILAEKHVDALVYTDPAQLVVRLFHEKATDQKLSAPKELESAREKLHECVARVDGSLTGEPRLFNCLTYDSKKSGEDVTVEASKVVTPQVIDRWRLAMVFQLLYSNDYAIPFGEEVGLVQEGPPWYLEPMWWNDLPNPESKRPTYRGDFYALIQMLNTFRSRFAPLRRGDFKPVIADDEKKLLAFSRSLPGDEVILVMNYGDAKQPVKLTVGRPGDLVPVLSPQLKPVPILRKGRTPPSSDVVVAKQLHEGGQTQETHAQVAPPPEPDLTKIPELRVGGQREFVKPDGTIDFWVDPMGVRIVLIGESAQGTKK